MKILAVVSTLDLKFRLGCTPAWWQILKALHETGNEVVAIPYLGKDIETVWWRAYRNPWRLPGELYLSLTRKVIPKRVGRESSLREDFVRNVTHMATLPVWRRYLKRILTKEIDFDVVIFFNVPLNQITGIPSEIKREFGIKTAFYDGDMPTILPEYTRERGFMFDYYRGATLEEYDLFFVNSEGVVKSLEQKGARNVRTLHYAADPDLFQPIPAEKRWEVAFFGYGSQARERWMTRMIEEPSRRIEARFAVGGIGYDIPLGRAALIGDFPISHFRQFCCSAKINLNISREPFVAVAGSSTARPFELAALASCVVSSPYNGLEKWFAPGREIIILSEDDDVTEMYTSILSDDQLRVRIGESARKRVLKDHTYKTRVLEMTKSISAAK